MPPARRLQGQVRPPNISVTANPYQTRGRVVKTFDIYPRDKPPIPSLLFDPRVSGSLSMMHATAVVKGKVVRFKLSPALARAHRANRGKTMSEPKAVEFVEAKRRARALRRAKPYLESRAIKCRR